MREFSATIGWKDYMSVKTRNIRHAIFFLMSAVLISFGFITTGNSVGFCFSKGSILSDKQLRQEARQSLMNFIVEESKSKAADGWPRGYRVGVIYGSSNIDFVGDMSRSLENKFSIEENFHMDTLFDGDNDDYLSSVDVAKPMTIVDINNSGPGGGGSTYFIDARDMLLDERREIFTTKLSLVDKLLGYGRHFYILKSVSVETHCCDAPFSYSDNVNYQEEKERSWRNTLSSLALGTVSWIDVVPVSNCGNVLTARNENNPRHHVVYVSHTQDKEKTQ